MELLTIRHITQRFGITTRTLRYYEQIGLIKSTRMEGYAYRVYDEDAVRRIQQILLLRSLRIPLRQIDALLSDPQSAAAILNAHIETLAREIDGLDTVRRAARKLLAHAQQGALNRIPEAGAWAETPEQSLLSRNFKEDFSMQDFNPADAAFSRFDNVRILYLPPATVAASHFTGANPEDAAGEAINRFIAQSRLAQCKPDFRLYGFNNPCPTPDSEAHGYEFWVTIPEDMPVPASLVKKHFDGGLYAAHCIKMGDFQEWGAFWQWVQDNPAYSYVPREPLGMCGSLEEHLNAYTVFQNLAPEDAKDAQFSQLDLLIPIQPKQQ